MREIFKVALVVFWFGMIAAFLCLPSCIGASIDAMCDMGAECHGLRGR